MAFLWRYTGTPDNAVNLAPTTGGWTMFYWKEVLKQAGWTVQSSSDGTTYNSSGDQITSGNSGADGFANNSAWVRLRDPAGVVEIIIQRGTTNLLWRQKVSHSARFTGGAPNATTPPTATDQQHVRGDDTPSFVSLLPTDNTYKAHFGADTAAPYTYFGLFVTNGAVVLASYMLYCGLTVGMFPSADASPWMIHWQANQANMTNMQGVGLGFGQGFYKKGLGGEAWVRFSAADKTWNSSALAGGVPVNPYNGNENAITFECGRSTTSGQGGWKGIPKDFWMRMHVRAIPDYFDVSSNRYAYFDDLVVKWPQSTAPVT